MPLSTMSKVRSATSADKSNYLIPFAPVSVVCWCACDTGEAGREPLSKGTVLMESAVGFLNDLAAARSDVNAEETLHYH